MGYVSYYIAGCFMALLIFNEVLRKVAVFFWQMCTGNDMSYRALMTRSEMKALCKIWRVSGLYNQRLVLNLWEINSCI